MPFELYTPKASEAAVVEPAEQEEPAAPAREPAKPKASSSKRAHRPAGGAGAGQFIPDDPETKHSNEAFSDGGE